MEKQIISMEDGGAMPIAVSVAHAAKLVDCSPDHIYRLIRRGRLKVRRVGRKSFISPAELRRVFAGSE